MTDETLVEETNAETTETVENTEQTQTEATAETTETTSAETTEKASDETKTEETAKSTLPDDWRELAANGNDDTLKLLQRFGTIGALAKALKDSQDLIRSGKLKRDMPDPKDEKAMAEWRKSEGIPDDATGYKLPDTVTKKLTDEDKPLLSNFTEFAFAKGARPDVVEIASEWYVTMSEQAAEQRAQEDNAAREAAEDELRKDWAHGEYKANTTLARRFMEQAPEIGAEWTEARLPDGRRIGDIPAFIKWASDMGRQSFGDVVFSSSDSETRHNNRKAELEKVMNTDIDRYFEEGMDKEYAEILEREQKRAKK